MEKMTFEDSMKKLETCAEKLRNSESTLEEAMNAYLEGQEYYKQCSEILNDAKAKVQMYKRKG